MGSTDRLIGVVAVLALAACDTGGGAPATPPVEPVAPPLTAAAVAYQCDSGQPLAVQYPDPASAVVTYQGRVQTLRAVEAATGARYSNAELQWWTAARDGMETGTLGQVSSTDGGVSAVLERCSRPLPPVPGAPVTPLPCRSEALRLETVGGDAGAGSRGLTLSLTNTGQAPCLLQGQPAVALLDQAGSVLPGLAVSPLTAMPAAVDAQASVTLAGGAQAWIDMTWSALPNESGGKPEPCPEARTIRLTPQGETVGLEVSSTLSPCGSRIRLGSFRPADPPTPERNAA